MRTLNIIIMNDNILHLMFVLTLLILGLTVERKANEQKFITSYIYIIII